MTFKSLTSICALSRDKRGKTSEITVCKSQLTCFEECQDGTADSLGMVPIISKNKTLGTIISINPSFCEFLNSYWA